MNINDLINCDDLHWDDDENKFVALSRAETDKLLISFLLNHPDADMDDIMKMIKWATQARCDELLLKNMLKGTVGISFLETLSEPIFFKADNYDKD